MDSLLRSSSVVATVLSATLLTLLFQSDSRGEDLDPKPVRFARIPGSAQSLVTQGKWTYVAAGNAGLVVLDSSDPSNPQTVASLATGGAAGGLAVVGNYAYIADGYDLAVVDVSDPVHPKLGPKLPMPERTISVAMSGNYAYLPALSEGVIIADVSDPAQPRQVGSFSTRSVFNATANADFNAGQITVAGQYAYVTGGLLYQGSGLIILDLATPAAPKLIGTWMTRDGRPSGLAVAGEFAYFATDPIGLYVINVSDLSSPQGVTVAGWPMSVQAVTLQGNRAYASGKDNLTVFDLSDSSHPLRVGNVHPSYYAQGLALAGDYVYLAEGIQGLEVINVGRSANPQRLGNYNVAGLNTVAADGDRACAGGAGESTYWIDVFDTSHPTKPDLKAHYPMPSLVQSVRLDRNLAYATMSASDDRNDKDQLVILDIGDPSGVSLVGQLALLDRYASLPLALAGDYAYVGHSLMTSGLSVIDVGDPSHPKLAGNIELNSSGLSGLAVSGRYAYLASETAGLTILDAESPDAMRVVATFEETSLIEDVAVAGDHLFLTSSTLETVDIHDPANPKSLGKLDPAELPAALYRLAVAGQYAYLASDSAWVVVDVSDMTRPRRVGGNSSSNPAAITATGGRIVSATSLGLTILTPFTPFQFLPARNGLPAQLSIVGPAGSAAKVQRGSTVTGPWTDWQTLPMTGDAVGMDEAAALPSNMQFYRAFVQ